MHTCSKHEFYQTNEMTTPFHHHYKIVSGIDLMFQFYSLYKKAFLSKLTRGEFFIEERIILMTWYSLFPHSDEMLTSVEVMRSCILGPIQQLLLLLNWQRIISQSKSQLQLHWTPWSFTDKYFLTICRVALPTKDYCNYIIVLPPLIFWLFWLISYCINVSYFGLSPS